MKKVLNVTALLMFSLFILSSCGKHGGSVKLASISVRPGNAGIAPGKTLQFIAIGINSDGTRQDLTKQVQWSTSDVTSTIATISNEAGYNGLLTTFNPNPALITITATSGGISGTAILNVGMNNWTIESLTNPILGIVSSSTPTYVAVGQDGLILTSSTGTTWTLQNSGSSDYLWSVAWSGSQFVAVGQNGTILTSADGGITWNSQNSGTTNILWGVARSGTQLIAVGQNGTILTSTDGGITWNSQNSNTPLNLSGIVSSGTGTLVAVGQGLTILTSSNGTTWAPATSLTLASTTLPDTKPYLRGVVWSPGTQSLQPQFATVGSGGAIFTSHDGANWTQQTSGTASYLDHITWSDILSLFIATGSEGVIITSPDGITWTVRASGTTNYLWDIASSPTVSRSVVVGLEGTILASPDGVTWTSSTLATINSLNATAWSGSQFVVVGRGGTILSSPTGSTWTLENSGTSHDLNGVVWSAGTRSQQPLFVAVGNNGTILTSPTGTVTAWTPVQTSLTTTNLNGIASSGTLFVAAGDSGTIITSPTGTAWTSLSLGSGTSNNLSSVAYAVTTSGPLFVAVGNGVILTSPMGTDTPWTSIATTDNLTSVAWSGTEFVAAIAGGGTLVSTDGATWISGPKP